MVEPLRISPEEAWQKVNSKKVLFVCGYEEEEKFKILHLHGGISLTEFESRLSSISKDQEIIFYCA